MLPDDSRIQMDLEKRLQRTSEPVIQSELVSTPRILPRYAASLEGLSCHGVHPSVYPSGFGLHLII